MDEYLEFVDLIQINQLSQEKDIWTVPSAKSGYKVASMYKFLMQQGHVLLLSLIFHGFGKVVARMGE
jgi:hypothetical protein